MTNPLTMKSWSPYVVGIGLGLLSWFAFATADQPLGVSTAFEHTAALTEKALVPQAEQTNEYFAKKAEEGKPSSSACSSDRCSVRCSLATAVPRPSRPCGASGSAAAFSCG